MIDITPTSGLSSRLFFFVIAIRRLPRSTRVGIQFDATIIAVGNHALLRHRGELSFQPSLQAFNQRLGFRLPHGAA